MYFNARSLLSKTDELRVVCEATKPDVIGIVETWLDSSVSDNELSLPNYQLLRSYRNRHGGGVAMYVSDSLVCNTLCIVNNNNFSFYIIRFIFRKVMFVHFLSPSFLTCFCF